MPVRIYLNEFWNYRRNKISCNRSVRSSTILREEFFNDELWTKILVILVPSYFVIVNLEPAIQLIFCQVDVEDPV